MNPESRALGQALLDHHRAMRQAYPPPKSKAQIIPRRYTIGYAKLCQAAGAPHLTQVVGNFLQEVAEWCSTNNLPPLNSLAVNQEMGMPGDGYDKAGGFLIIHWDKDVRECIMCDRYPATMP